VVLCWSESDQEVGDGRTEAARGLLEELDTHWKQWIPCSLLPVAFTGGKVGRCRGWRQIQVQIRSLVYFACSPVVFSSLFSNVLVGLFDCKNGGRQGVASR
jgi:hypothetical protein